MAPSVGADKDVQIIFGVLIYFSAKNNTTKTETDFNISIVNSMEIVHPIFI